MQITQEYLKENIHYDPLTGIFTWVKKGRGRKINNTPGYINRAGPTRLYRNITFFDKEYGAHRIAWMYLYGEFPKEDIDHINGDGLDNRLCNLRAVSRADNLKNKRVYKNNKSGVMGVSLRGGKWRARIKLNGLEQCLGSYASKAEAIKARKAAEQEHGFHENHGK